jgi:hypothetical protein
MQVNSQSTCSLPSCFLKGKYWLKQQNCSLLTQCIFSNTCF